MSQGLPDTGVGERERLLPSSSPPLGRVSLTQLAALHLKIGLLSFGGGLSGFFFHEVVTKRAWMTDEEFFSGLTICQILPGTNVANLAVFIGQRVRGTAGAAVALVSLLLGPFFVLIGFALVYARIRDLPLVGAGLDGVAAASIGLLGTTVVRGARASPHLRGVLVAAVTAVAVGILRLPLVPVVAVMVPASIGLAYLSARRRHG